MISQFLLFLNPLNLWKILYDNIDLIYETEFSTIFGDNIKSNSIIKIPIHILSKDNTEFIYDLFTNEPMSLQKTIRQIVFFSRCIQNTFENRQFRI